MSEPQRCFLNHLEGRLVNCRHQKPTDGRAVSGTKSLSQCECRSFLPPGKKKGGGLERRGTLLNKLGGGEEKKEGKGGVTQKTQDLLFKRAKKIR